MEWDVARLLHPGGGQLAQVRIPDTDDCVLNLLCTNSRLTLGIM